MRWPVRRRASAAGRPFFPALDERIERDLVEQRTFGSRMVYLRYRHLRPPAQAGISASPPLGTSGRVSDVDVTLRINGPRTT
jgi:hypothetical protein